ncbi:outer membrane protein assembly factor BamA [Anianabacter salinae]|uniref:outer membrane protein assembly factor BamA n=1 Tax=Anianabacter salinae TaxID=2851023 RepID=UPI00225DE8EE|nr:outer membrane protein assembly factor BamA [Anianabacter salinae]MBV0911985.1 outer membrane protein assembly factor BamA [Anianabacter salinae]
MSDGFAGIYGSSDKRRSNTLLVWVAAIVLVLIGMLASVTPAAAQSYRFSDVQISGNQRIESGTILSYAAIPRGQTVSAGELNAAYQNIVNSGLFETVSIEPRGNTLVIEVTEFPTINRISIEGNRRLDDDALTPLLQSQSRRVYSPTLAQQDAASIIEAYQSQGRLAASVDPVIIRRSNNRVDLVFEVAEGQSVEVERVSFVGNRAYTDRRLRRVLETKQAGLLRAIVSSDTFVADRVEFDKQLLRDFYLARGYIDMQVLSASSEFSRERNAFFVVFNVQEGQPFSFGDISVSSDLAEIDLAAYQDAIRIRPGQTYSPMLVDRTIARLETLAVQQGLDFIRANPRVTRNDRALTLDLEFVIERGPRIFVERIDIEGNSTTLDRVIRTQFDTVEGDPFNPREIREAAERIRALDLFEDANVESREGTSPDQVIIDVDVEEKPTGSVGFGASYGVSSGVGFNFSFSERNFLGRGQTVGADLTLGGGTQTYSFTFIEPSLLGRDVGFSLGATYSTSDAATNTSYNTTSFSVRPAISFPTGENSRLELRYTFGGAEVFSVPAASSAILQTEQGYGLETYSAIGYQFEFDNRLGGLNPDAGVLLRFSQDIAGLGGSDAFLRTNALAVAETTLPTRDITFRAIFEGGAINSLGGNPTKVTDRYFLSTNQLRGFDVRGTGPRDLNAGNRDALGGNFYATARFETDFPIGLPEEYGIAGGAFFDVGTVFGLGNTAGTGGAVDDNAYLRASIGLSVFWDTPIGPLRFNFAQPLIKQPYDIERNFDLTVSTKF